MGGVPTRIPYENKQVNNYRWYPPLVPTPKGGVIGKGDVDHKLLILTSSRHL